MLKSSGLSQAQAEAIVRVIAKAQESIATKHDINELKLEMSARFERIDGEMKLNRWMLGAVLASSSKKCQLQNLKSCSSALLVEGVSRG